MPDISLVAEKTNINLLNEPITISLLSESININLLGEPISVSFLSESININLSDPVYYFNADSFTTLSYFDSLPIFASNQDAISNNYLNKVYKTSTNQVLVGINQTPFILNLSKAWAYFRRLF